MRDASSAVAAFGCDLRMGPLSYGNLEGENTVCLSTHALTGFQLMVSSFKLGDEISSSVVKKICIFGRYFSSPGQSERVFPSGFSLDTYGHLRNVDRPKVFLEVDGLFRS